VELEANPFSQKSRAAVSSNRSAVETACTRTVPSLCSVALVRGV
jgi:hypothetical protein